MKKFLSLIVLSLSLSLTNLGGAENLMHPLFRPVDDSGQPVQLSGHTMNEQASCGGCHDVGFIRAHSRHWNEKTKVSCLACHFSGGSLPKNAAAYDAQGRLNHTAMLLEDPSSSACLNCHGVGSQKNEPLLLPENYLTGMVFSGQTPSESGLNLSGKGALQAPWDIHAARLLQCGSCHSAPNGPGRKASGPEQLLSDPRHEDLSLFLRQPDHRLVVQDCRQCHDASAIHKFLPYVERHMNRLACQACHVPEIHAPVLMEEDRTFPQARQVWRNMTGSGPLNTRVVTPFQPWLLPVSSSAGIRLQPVNLVTERYWADAKNGEISRADLLKASGKNLVSLSVLGENLKKLGVASPHVLAVTHVQPIYHGIQPGPQALRACADCHAAGSRMDPRPRVSLGLLPMPELDEASQSAGEIIADEKGSLLKRPPLPAGLTLPGQGWKSWSTRLGFVFFLLVFWGVLGHAAFRLATAKQRRSQTQAHTPLRKVYLYGVYERLWHWLMASTTLLLIYTGLSIHFASLWASLGLLPAVKLHNALAIVLLANAFLSLFYHLSTRRIRQFVPPGSNLKHEVLAQARYYLDGIFAGAPHPAGKSVERKLNALQQITYMGLLNVLFPFQVLSGVLLWMAGHWPGLLEPAGGLSTLTPLHELGSWLLLSFTIGHVYLTTTGHTLSSNLKAMVDGFDFVDADEIAPKEELP